ncbi:histidine phosphotransferase family protein [Planktotalea sp.]|uniref:histidine phosphotransferase family protein n=1 Tax=Planktotalea sp. TaxID=2029877 RepID=UPI003D6BBB59
MGEHSLQFAALVGSRICHDLISPIGAINNGMELIAMSGQSTSPEMALISESIDAANARIRFFRIAYGPASDAQQLSASEIASLLTDITKGSRLSLTYDLPDNLPRSEAQLIFLAFQCLEQALPYGGDISLSPQNGRWRFIARSDRLSFDPNLWSMLENGKDVASDTMSTPAHVQFLLLPLHAAAKGRRIEVTQGDGTALLVV